MKILIRNYNGEPYVWKDAEYGANGKFMVCDENGSKEFETSEIISINGDNRNKFVKCSACGKIVRNTAKSIAKHKNVGMNHEACMTCKYLRALNAKPDLHKYTQTSDGRYIEYVKRTVDLTCSISYYKHNDIKSEEARSHCMYHNCTTAIMQPIQDIFTLNPGIFDDMITVDKILANGYNNRREQGCVVYYEIKSRNRITAVVNKLNIVQFFFIDYHSARYTVYYSKSMGKLFSIEGASYKEFHPYNMNDTTISRIQEKIASLYN